MSNQLATCMDVEVPMHSTPDEINGPSEIYKYIEFPSSIKQIFDVGAYNYFHSICLASFFPRAAIHAFEADTSNFNSFAHVKKYQDRIVKHNLALANKCDRMWFHTSRGAHLTGWGAAGSLLEPSDKLLNTNASVKDGSFQFTHVFPVQATTISKFATEHDIKKIDIIHIDVQGAEIYVIRGLGEYRPTYIFAETCEHESYKGALTKKHLDNELIDMGYQILEEFKTDTLYQYKE